MSRSVPSVSPESRARRQQEAYLPESLESRKIIRRYDLHAVNAGLDLHVFIRADPGDDLCVGVGDDVQSRKCLYISYTGRMIS